MPKVEVIEEHHIPATRTARYYTMGGRGDAVRDVWFVLHGYGQLANPFLRHFEPLVQPSRLIVAPEALARFYLDPVATPGGQFRVGASWMTREDRLTEIDDYVRYLDAVYARVFKVVPWSTARVTVFAFSQGTATACRWLAHGAARADRLMLWAGEVPPDLDWSVARARLAALDLVVVVGRGDELITSKIVARDTGRLQAEGVPFRLVEFEGTHEIQRETLERLAQEGGRGKREGGTGKGEA